MLLARSRSKGMAAHGAGRLSGKDVSALPAAFI